VSSQTRVTQFILRGFSDAQELRLVVVLFFLFVYLFGLLGNISIITVVFQESCLQSSMHFLKNCSFLDKCYTLVTIPKVPVTSIMGSGLIFYLECVAQPCVFITLSSTESLLLMAVAYDQCVAVLEPCSMGPWPGHLACTDYHLNEEVGFCVSSCVALSSFALTVLSYAWVSSAIMWKAFSTCSSRLTTVLLFYGTGSFVYLRPASQYSPTQGRLASSFYSILPPILNPKLYCPGKH
uniref:Olfactory receptor n=1 Tax=Chinchilla lanigera TaxID=34839 RepID=A0A8C2UM11_CHILA